MKAKWTIWICLAIWSLGGLRAQVIEISPAQKTLARYDDYQILGRNSIGTIVHYYSKGNNHRLQVFNAKLRPLNEVDLEFSEKRVNVQQILLGEDHILVFYSVIGNSQEYLKLKKINYRLDVLRDGVLLDSIARGAVNSYQGYFVKPSLNDKFYVAFTFEEKSNRLELTYILMDRFQKVLKKGTLWTEDRSNLKLESVKVSNNGDLLVVVGHENRRIVDDQAFSAEKYTVHLIGPEDSEPVTRTISEPEMLYKDLLTNWDEDNRRAIVVGIYQHDRDDENVGVFLHAGGVSGETLPYTRLPFSEPDFSGSNSPFRRWDDNAEIQRPKRIIPRSDGGFIFINEGERHTYRLLTGTGTNPGYPYYPEYTNYFDENYYYDLLVTSVNPDGSVDWKANLPKKQITENDRGRYSSFFYLGNNNVSKLLFVDDIYGNGNLTEFNFNPNGSWNRRVLLNSFREDLLLVPAKGIQLSGSELVLPSEKKNRLRLVKITY